MNINSKVNMVLWEQSALPAAARVKESKWACQTVKNDLLSWLNVAVDYSVDNVYSSGLCKNQLDFFKKKLNNEFVTVSDYFLYV